MAMALTFYYGNLELGAYPWEAGDHSEHTNDKDFVLEYLIMFSNMCFHLRFSLWITHNVDYTKRMFFVFLFFFEKGNVLDNDIFIKKKVNSFTIPPN